MPAKKIIVANWKMNPSSLGKAQELYKGVLKLKKSSNYIVVVCPPFPYIGSLKPAGGIFLGAQNFFYEKEGAFTGEVSASMLKSQNVSYVILGHSERRKLGETDEIVSKKIGAAFKENLKPIVCIGEKERDADGHFFNNIKKQIHESFSKVSKKQISKVIIAYEPLWAISTAGKGAMEPAQIHETVLFIKKVLADKFGKNEAPKVKILYGGSVDQNDAYEVLNEGTTDGLLVGRASLKAETFAKILENVDKK